MASIYAIGCTTLLPTMALSLKAELKLSLVRIKKHVAFHGLNPSAICNSTLSWLVTVVGVTSPGQLVCGMAYFAGLDVLECVFWFLPYYLEFTNTILCEERPWILQAIPHEVLHSQGSLT